MLVLPLVVVGEEGGREDAEEDATVGDCSAAGARRLCFEPTESYGSHAVRWISYGSRGEVDKR
jgi:hypothetical protein